MIGIRPGYHSGFAPRDGEPLYPELWRNCVFAAAPLLGPSGATLRDSSPFRNHCEMINMNPETDWVVSGGRFAINFDGANNNARVAAGMPGWVGISAWIYVAATPTTYGLIAESTNTTFATGLGLATRTSGLASFEGRPNEATFRRVESTSTIPVLKPTHIFGQVNLSNMEMWLNGRREAITACTPGSTPYTRPDLNIGGASAGDDNAATGATFFTGALLDIMLFSVPQSGNIISLLSQCPGIAYETQRRRRNSTQAGAAAAIRRHLMLLGVGR